MQITDIGAVSNLTVNFPDSEERIKSPYRPGDGDCKETAIHRAARWAMSLASGRDPGALYSRSLGRGKVLVWTRRRIHTRMVTVSLSDA